MKILLIEDNVNDANILKRKLARKFKDLFILRVESEGEYRKELFKDYDIILSDYSLPDFDGMKALEIRNKELPLMPFIIVTGSVNEMTAVDCLIAGADNYIIKEHLGRLVPAINKAIKDKIIEKEKIRAKKALLETEQMYNQVVENAELGILIESAEGKLIYSNSKFQKIFGYSRSEILNLTYSDIVFKDDLRKVEDFRRDRKLKNVYQDYEIRGVNKKGELIWLQIHVETNRWKGKSNGNRFYIRDITTERKRNIVNKAIDEVARLALEINDLSLFAEQSYNIISKYINVSTFFVAIYNPKDDRYIFPYSISDRDQLKKYQSLKISGGFIDKVRISGKSLLLKRDKMEKMISGGKIEEYGTPAKCWLGVPLIHEKQVIGVAGLQSFDDENAFDKDTLMFIESFSSYISMKIYQQKMLDDILEKEKQYSDLYNFSPHAIIVHQKGKIVMANPAAVELSGHNSIEEMVGSSILKYLHPSMEEVISKRINSVINERKKQQSLEEIFITADGREIIVEAVSIPFEYNGEPAAQVIMKNVTEERKTKELLQQSEEKFRLAFKTSLDAIAISDLQTGKYVEVNEGLCYYTGYTSEEILGKTAFDIKIWYSEKERDKVIEAIRDKGFITNYQTKFRMKSGKIEDVLLSGRMIKLDGKNYLITTSRIITSFIHVQEKLKISEQKFNQIFNSASDNIILYRFDEDTMVFHEVNQMFYSSYGYSPEEILNQPASITVAENSRSAIKSNIELIRKGESLIFESVHIKKSGGVFPVEISARMINIGGEDFVLSIERDISERKIAERKIKESEDKFRKGFISSPDAIAVINLTTGKALDVNDSFVELTGYTLEDLKSSNESYIPYKVDDSFREFMSELMEKGEVRNKEMTIIDKKNNLHYVLASVSRIKIHNQPHIMVITKDITNLKKIQKELIEATRKAEESDKLKSAFLANMSHEIRTPMNHIIGFTEFIKHGVTEEELLNYISIIQKSSNHLLELINDIIDVSKVEAGLFEMNLENLSPTSILKEIFDNFSYDQRLLSNPDLELINEIKHQSSVRVIADRVRLRQVLYNLVENAFKFTERGLIRFGFEDRGEGMLTFYVNDTGHGIDMEDQKIIFDRFRQASNDDTKFSNGTGLGLALSKAFVELMGGKIWVESEIGKGSTFYFSIPLIEKSLKSGSIKNENNPDKLKDTKILLIDEDENDSFLVTVFLDGFISPENIIIETNPDSIMSILKQEEITIVFLDISKYVDENISLLNRIKNIYPDVPVIAQTSYAFQSKEFRLIEKGFDDILEKPFSNEKIMTAIMNSMIK